MNKTAPIDYSKPPKLSLKFKLVIGSIWFVGSQLAHLVRILLLSSLLAFLLDPAVRWFEGRLHIGRVWSTLLVFAITLVVVVLFVAILVPVVVQQARAFQAGPSIERAMMQIADFDAMLAERLDRYVITDVQLTEAIREWVVGTVLAGFVPNVLQLAGDIVLVPFILFFLFP